MSKKMLAKVAPDLTDETLGTVVIGMIEDEEMSVSSFGELVRTALGSGSGNVPTECCGGESLVPVEIAAGDARIKADLPLSNEDRAPFNTLLYGSFNKFLTRSVSALSDVLGLTENGVLALVLTNSDFEVVTSRTGGGKMISTSSDVLGDRAESLIYDSFETFNRRSLGSLARITGLTEDAVAGIVAAHRDFRVSTCRDTSRIFVIVRGL